MKKNFGFGCMRLPIKGGNVDHAEFSDMIDYFNINGNNPDGQIEISIDSNRIHTVFPLRVI